MKIQKITILTQTRSTDTVMVQTDLPSGTPALSSEPLSMKFEVAAGDGVNYCLKQFQNVDDVEEINITSGQVIKHRTPHPIAPSVMQLKLSDFNLTAGQRALVVTDNMDSEATRALLRVLDSFHFDEEGASVWELDARSLLSYAVTNKFTMAKSMWDKIHGLIEHLSQSEWGHCVTVEDIKSFLKDGAFRQVAHYGEPYDSLDHDPGKDYHAARIAYLMSFGVKGSDVIDVDLGIPSKGYIPSRVIDDGHHRVIAAALLDQPIRARAAGSVSVARRLSRSFHRAHLPIEMFTTSTGEGHVAICVTESKPKDLGPLMAAHMAFEVNGDQITCTKNRFAEKFTTSTSDLKKLLENA